MSTPRIIIELSPSRIEVGVIRPTLSGAMRPVEWRAERLALAEWPTPFTTALPELQTTLTKLLAELHITHAAATLIPFSPGSVSLVAPIPRTVSTATAEQAAKLAMTGVADFPVDDAPYDTLLLHTDPSSKAKSTATEDADSVPQQHVLACADAEERSSALCAMLEAAGLSVDRILPAESVAIAETVRCSMDASANAEAACVVWLGEHFTTLAASSHGRLLFVRTIATGTEMLVDALRRPLRSRDTDEGPLTLDPAGARNLLLTAGIPAPDADIPGHPQLIGSAILPHLQPLVQRLSVEIKQSLRFGVSDALRPSVQLKFIGPGSAVPNFAKTIARAAGFSILAETASDDLADAQDSCTGGLIAAFVRNPELSIALLPRDRRHTRSLRSIRRAMLIGSALAVAFVAYEAFDSHNRLSQERARLAAETARIQADAPALAAREQSAQASMALSAVEQRVRTTMTAGADWSPALSALSNATPEPVRVNTLSMQAADATPTISVRGHVRFHPSADPPSIIRAYVAALQQLPIVQSVTLGATSRAAISGHDAQVFELSIKVVPLPPRYLLPSATRPPVAGVPTPEAQ
ncbi:MAG: hypothetical protein K2W85_07310 [Phycisphaerales bacterium]|nr:hypothetical protein [Phycisphaerales bacterium]